MLIVIMEDILIGILTPVFSSPFVEPGINPEKELKIPQNIKYLGLLLIEAALLLGVSNISFINISIDKFLACTGILLLTRHFGAGAGAGAGAVAGMAVSSGGANLFPEYTGLYAVSGMIAGMLQKSKIAAALSFIVTHIIFFLFSDNMIIDWPELLLAAAVFFIVPDIKEGRLAIIKNRIKGGMFESDEMKRVKRNISEKLRDVSKALHKLGHVVEKQITSNASDDLNEECKTIIGQLTDQVCCRCNKSLSCWEKKLFYTYNVMCKIIDFIQKGETYPSGEALNELKHFCVKSEAIVDALSRIIEIKKVERIWREYATETKYVVSEQIYSLSGILTRISSELFNDEEFFGEEEKKICTMLRRQGYSAVEAEVKKGNARFTAEIYLEGCKGYKNCRKEMENIVSQALGVKMQLEEEDCKGRGKEECLLFFKEKENLNVTTGIARLKKNNSGISGDSFTFLKTKDGKYIVAVSDGMGSGIEANKLSETAIGLFEQLLDCGLSVRLSLSLVNMMLTVRNPEQYATMDISAIDLYTGETEFYKMGAMPTIIINERNMDMIQANNLPAGLHKENPLKSYRRKVGDGEFIIMMTDGVYENIGNGDADSMLKAVLGGINTLNPQELAEHMLKNVCTSNENVPDDMTVLVAKLWKRAG
ncbi:MAG: SpoIIE family protein phosphatase [Clostridiaceae bacterium]|nr:SpoIIE family protein phosphatase [Clostridiaceae bacterium]